MDIALCLSYLRPNAKWRDASTYARLQATWDDTTQTIPTEAELEAEQTIIDNMSVVKYCYSTYGTVVTQVNGNYTAGTGEVVFPTTPTTAELEAAFPSTAAQKTFTIPTNAVSGDTITVEKQTLTAGTNFAVGSTIATTVANIVTYLKSLPLITGNYNITSTDTSFTLTERFAGGGLTIADATCTGTVVITSTSIATSVWGYTTQIKYNKKVALKAEYNATRQDYRDSYFGALVDGETALAATILTEGATLKTNLYMALEAINDE